MSECVVRMEMPKNCEMCHLRVNDSPTNVLNWICAINQWPTFYCKKSQNHANEDEYLHDCPIVAVLPENHGRLVDADVLYEKRYIVGPGDIVAPITVVDACYISGGKIIVPATKGEFE